MLTKVIKLMINVIPEDAAYALTCFLAALPQKTHLKNQDKEILSQAKRIEFGPNNSKTAWSWGEGPLVILVHGWGSCGAHMGVLATMLASKGFQSVAIDITGHGDSTGRRINFRDFYQDIGTLVRFLDQDVYACVGHSAGGLCMMAARELENLSAKKYVCISAPQKPYPPINLIRKKLGVSDAVIKRYKNFLADQFNCRWGDITRRVYSSDSESQLLLIYDKSDRFVDHMDGDEIKAYWPSATLVKTWGIKHSQQIRSPVIQEKVVEFLVDGEALGKV